MSKHHKNQHIVSQFYLRNFSSKPKHIWRYDKLYPGYKEKPISALPTEEYIYDKVPGAKEGSWEYKFGDIENITGPVFEKVINDNSLRNLTRTEFETIALFISAQFIKTKPMLANAQRFQEQFWGPIKEFAKAHGAKFDFPEMEKKELWMNNFSSVGDYAEVLMKKNWFLFKTEQLLYTSDNPVILNNTANKKSNRNTIGLDVDGIEIYLPISSNLCLFLLCERVFAQAKGQTFAFPEGFAQELNTLQVCHSQRYVFCSKPSFSLVESIIKEIKK